jgi:hypothetical protein
MRACTIAFAILSLLPAIHHIHAVPTGSSKLVHALVNPRWTSDPIDGHASSTETRREAETVFEASPIIPARGGSERWQQEEASPKNTRDLVRRVDTSSNPADDFVPRILNMRRTTWMDSTLLPVPPEPLNETGTQFQLSTKKPSTERTTHLMPIAVAAGVAYHFVFRFPDTPTVIKVRAGRSLGLSALGYPHFEARTARLSFQATEETQVFVEIMWPAPPKKYTIEMQVYGPNRKDCDDRTCRILPAWVSSGVSSLWSK